MSLPLHSRVGLAVLLALAVSSAGCRGCDDEAAAPAASGPSRAWLEGRLPPEANSGTPRDGGTLVVRLPAEPAMLTRLHDAGQDAWAARITLGHVYETLLQLDRANDGRGPLKPWLAERWERSPDGLTTTFHLREGVTFHNGDPFTSADVTALLDAVMDPQKPTAVMRGHLEGLKAWEAPDPHTVVLRWERPTPMAVRTFALVFPMVPKALLEGDFGALALHRAPVGTGPFRFAGWDTGRAITLERFDGYWGPKAHLDKVVFRIVKDHTVATQLFEQGAFHLMTAILPSVWRSLEEKAPKNAWAQEGYHRLRYPENSYAFIGWNHQRPFFADPQVRRALTHLVDTRAIFQHVTLGLDPITTCPFYARGASCDPALEAPDSKERLRPDPKKARALLDAAGWRDSDQDGVRDKDGVPFRFTLLLYAHSVFGGKLGPLLQEDFRRAGIDVSLERVEWAVYTQRLREHDFDAVNLAWSNQDVEDDLFYNFHSSQARGGGNYVSFSDPEVDRLIEQSRRTFDPAARAALHRALHRRIYALQPYTFLGARSALDAAKKEVRGLRPSVAWYRLSEVWLEP